jgi:flagellar biosynthesis GTPase FlhF
LEFPGNRFEVSPFWLQGRQVEKAVGREGVRLFAEDGKISTTLGAEMEGEPCYMGFAAVALAAGANEAVFALVQPNPEDGNKGDEVAEFGPDSNAATRCPTDSRSLEINKEIITSSTPIPVTVTEGAKVKFGVSLSNPGADTPFEFEWVFGDGHTETKRIEPPKYKWPEPSVEYSYATPGIKHASVRVYGAFGTSETTPVEVMVSPATPPVAGFSSPGGPAEEAVPFETTGSIAPPGTHIERYEWNFGDGQERSTPSATTHTYAKPGTYTVTLKVYDLGRTSEAVSHSVVISESAAEKAEREARELKEREEHEAQVKAAEAAAQAKAAAEAKARAEAEAAAQAKVVAEAAARKKLEEEQARRQSSVKPPTRAQLLAKALTACRKLKPAKKRTSCAKAAQKRYGPPKKGGHKGGKGKK